MKGFLHFVSGGMFLSMTLLACTPAPVIPTLVGATLPPPQATLISVTQSLSTPIVIQHKVIPSELPAARVNHTGDYDSSLTQAERRAPGGDRFVLGQFERPFNAETMDIYYPDLDIQEVSIFRDSIWVYASIKLKGPDQQDSFPGNYALEFDLDLDGAGDYLVIAHRPSLKEWTSLGVQVWADENNDVGGKVTIHADEHGKGDGYEYLIFDQGRGNNPDVAWVRVAPNEPATIQIAVLKLLLVGDRAFLVGAWAGYDDLQPGLFDLTDHFTQAEAGEAMANMGSLYPIKELSGVDNTCRMAIGFQPTGVEPGLCTSLTSP
jgi:hypothetical protein